MAGPETGDRQTVRLFAVLGMGGSELGKVYLNVNKYIVYHTTDPGEQMAFVSSFLSWYDVHHLPDILESNEMLQARRYKYPVYKEDLSDLAKYTEMFTFGQNRKKWHEIIFKCRFLPNKI